MNNSQTYRLDSTSQTLVMMADNRQLPSIVYWGKALPMSQDVDTLGRVLSTPVGTAALWVDAYPSVCPEIGHAFAGHPGISGHSANGTRWLTQFTLTECSIDDDTFNYTAIDEKAGLQLTGYIRLDKVTNVVEASHTLFNVADTDFFLGWLAAPVFPGASSSTDLIDFTGNWCHEFQQQKTPWKMGQQVRECRLGRTSHEHFPGLLALGNGANECHGEVWAFHLGWSGGHRHLAEEMPTGKRQIQFGAMMHAGEIQLAAGDSYTTPILYAAYSNEGLNGVSWAFHQHVRTHIVNFPKAATYRPVYYNSWESIYFDLNVEKLKSLIDSAADIGVERFILDDGWFPGRHDDSAGLGDWRVDKEKFPDGLTPLIDYAASKGLSFGLWLEPEMVNKASDLYREHPDWVLGVDDYGEHYCRHQHVLNLSKAEVSDYLFSCIDALLTDNDITYIKWDHNRNLSLPGDEQGKPAVIKQTYAFYALLARLREAHPTVEIESCASGGGRIDYGVLKHTHRVWLSDSNDAIERLRMQRVAGIFLPPEIVGSHIGALHSHTSGRRLPANFRATVAASRHMGLELGPQALAVDDVDAIRRGIGLYKQWREVLHSGRWYQLLATEDNVLAEMTVAVDGSSFILFYGQLGQLQRQAPAPIQLIGLEQQADYQITWENADEVSAPSTMSHETPLRTSAVRLSGAALMQSGLQLSIAFPETIWVVTGQKL